MQVNIKDLDAAIMFSTNVMNEQTENNKQEKLFLENFYFKTHEFTVKSNSRNTDWIDRIRSSTSKIGGAHGKNKH